MIFGILTFHNADNYGAVLQCYALQKALEKRYPGNKVDIVDYKCPEIERSYQPRFNILKPWRNLNYFKILKKRDIFRSFREKYDDDAHEPFMTTTGREWLFYAIGVQWKHSF